MGAAQMETAMVQSTTATSTFGRPALATPSQLPQQASFGPPSPNQRPPRSRSWELAQQSLLFASDCNKSSNLAHTAMKLPRYSVATIVYAAMLISCTPASAFFHQWKLGEFFSSPDGNVQFIEMQITSQFATGEVFAEGVQMSSVSTGKVFTFHGQLSGSTPLDKKLLIASPNFGSLPGAVMPDFTFDDPNFFNPAGDTIKFGPASFPFDSRTFASVPTDGVNSRQYFPSETIATNMPTNFANQSGSVNLAPGITPTGDYN